MTASGAVIVGAGPAGLACAACLKQAGVEAVVLEKSDAVAPVWRRHYDRLHLHTNRAVSGLPGFALPKTYPRYPDRAQVVDYLEQYARHFDLRPHFGAAATSARRDDGLWRVETAAGTFAAANLIMATGIADFPHRPHWPGEARFGGDIRHSSDYRNPAPYAGRKVLVVGFGNSGAEIALDLAEHGVPVALAVRGPVNIVPRDLLGIPILSIAIALSVLPPAVADTLSAPVVRLAVRSLARLGLQRAPRGPLATIAEQARVPLIDM
ncbi:MAG: NAD(P)/FAD-dependent oxidoreductase, partial [Alphaproteobacteria bacterium]|nr:NAD(P)/FAD-dependent oxidoreductase [Alphaproteobacteria bacterium]